MNQKQVKRLRRVFNLKGSAVLAFVRNELGDRTEQFQSTNGVWNAFKKLYKEGRVPESIFADVPERSIEIDREHNIKP